MYIHILNPDYRRTASREYGQAKHGLERVAVIDIDVHHGNGTQAGFKKNPTTFYGSSHQVWSRMWGGVEHCENQRRGGMTSGA